MGAPRGRLVGISVLRAPHAHSRRAEQDRALLNRAALRAVGYTKETPEPPRGEIQRDQQGNPTGMLIAKPNATILYSTLAKGPKLSHEEQLNSTRHFMCELNRFGLTSVIDAGGGQAQICRH